MNSTTKPLSATESTLNSPTPSFADFIEHEDLDGGGSDFGWSSVPPEVEALCSRQEISNAVFQGLTSADELDNVEDVAAQAEPLKDSTRKHPTYFWECISFLVEGVEFQLPRYKFVEESERFMDIVTAGAVFGTASPIQLDSTSLSDFEAFLKALLPRSSAMYDDKPDLTKDEWTSVLKLSTRWYFNDLRTLAIKHLSTTEMDAIERISLAKEYKVYHWLLDGYGRVLDRLASLDPEIEGRGTLSAEEGAEIGMDVALKLSGIAILRMRRSVLGMKAKPKEDDILVAFKDEFAAMRLEGVPFRTRKGKEVELKEIQDREQEKAEPLSRNILEKEKEEERIEDKESTKGVGSEDPNLLGSTSGVSQEEKEKPEEPLRAEGDAAAKESAEQGPSSALPPPSPVALQWQRMKRLFDPQMVQTS